MFRLCLNVVISLLNEVEGCTDRRYGGRRTDLSESGDMTTAAIASALAGETYGLVALRSELKTALVTPRAWL